jgi:hypothetical protein
VFKRPLASIDVLRLKDFKISGYFLGVPQLDGMVLHVVYV